MARTKQRSRRNQGGFLTVDFLFAITMAAGLCMLMFAFATTLSMLEISQYIAFSTARAGIAGHLDEDHQIAAAQAKFASFADPGQFPSLAPLLKNGWFQVDAKSLDIRLGGTGGTNGTDFNSDYGYETNALPQQGVRFRFHAPIMEIHLPFLGSIEDADSFGANITGLLFREPTQSECQGSMVTNVRWTAIKALDSSNRFQKALTTVMSYQGHPSDNDYFGFEDNGC